MLDFGVSQPLIMAGLVGKAGHVYAVDLMRVKLHSLNTCSGMSLAMSPFTKTLCSIK